MKLFALTILSLLVTLTTVVETRKTYRGYRRVKSYNPAPQNYNQVHYLQYLGNLTENAPEKHPLGGKVYFRKDDESVITISRFFYTKPGPDAFFWAGEEGECDEKSINNKSYNLAPGSQARTDYYDKSQPILPVYEGKQSDVILRLPKGVSVKDLKWLCIWCRKFKVNFGGLKLNAEP